MLTIQFSQMELNQYHILKDNIFMAAVYKAKHFTQALENFLLINNILINEIHHCYHMKF